MHGVLASVENLNEKSKEIFDRLDAACSQANARISGLEERLSAAAARIEGARGSTAALKVQSARTFCGRGKPELHTARLVIHEDLLLSVCQTASLPEELSAPLPSASSYAEQLARVSELVTHHRSLVTPDPPFKKKCNEMLLPVAGRLSSVSELFLLNSKEQPYRVRQEVDNLAEPEEEFMKPKSSSLEASKTEEGFHVDLEDESAMEDLRFPRPATAEVTFDLPDVLPDLGHVAHIKWSEDGNETERPAWDVVPAELARGASTANPARDVPAAPRAKRPPPPPPKQPVAAATPAAPVPAQATPVTATPSPVTEKPKSQAPPAPAVKGKGKGKGKGKDGKGKGGKGPPPPPPPPAKKASTGAPPAKPPAAQAGAAGVGKAAMFADIRSGAKLRKVAPPKERSGASVGRVV